MSDQIVLSHITHGKIHSLFYESDHGNDDLPFIPMGEPFTQRVVSQGNAPRNVLQGPKPLHTSRGVYKVGEPTH